MGADQVQGLLIDVQHASLGPIQLPGPPLRFFEISGDKEVETTLQHHQPPPLLGADNTNLDTWLEARERLAARALELFCGRPLIQWRRRSAPTEVSTSASSSSSIGFAAAATAESRCRCLVVPIKVVAQPDRWMEYWLARKLTSAP